MAGVGRGGQWLSGQGGGYPQRPSLELAIAPWGVDCAEHEPVDGPGDGGHGGSSCGGENLVWSGVFERDDRSHQYRDVPESTDGPGGRGDQSDCGEGCGEGGVHGKRFVLLGYNGAGVTDRLSDRGGAPEEHCPEACGDWNENQKEAFGEIGKVGQGGSAYVHRDPVVYTRQGFERGGEEEKTVSGTSANGVTDETSGSGESEWTERESTGGVSGSPRFLRADDDADSALDQDGLPPSWQDHQFVGDTSACDYEEQGGEGCGVWKAVDHHAIGEGLHHRDTVPEAGRGCRHIDCAGGVGAFRKNHGRKTEDGGVRSWGRRAEESQDPPAEEDSECDFPEGERVIDWAWTEHGSQGPPGACALGSGHRDDQASAIRIQQTEGKIIGGVCLEGAGGDFGSEFNPPGERLDGSGGDGVKRKEEKKVKDGKSGSGRTEIPPGMADIRENDFF